jgi:hypothetical protein
MIPLQVMEVHAERTGGSDVALGGPRPAGDHELPGRTARRIIERFA